MRNSRLFRAASAVLFFAALALNSSALAITVTSTADSGAGTLRAAITAANAGGVPAAIDFNIGGCAGVCRIQLASALPAVTVPLTIDGYTQPGSSPNTRPIGNDAVFRIVLDVNGVTGGGLTLSPAATNSVVRGLNIQKFGDGVAGTGILVQANGVAVEGNFIGVDATGMIAASNHGAFGVHVAGPGNVRVGGTSPAQRNVITAYDGAAIYITAAGAGALIQGNYLGTNAAGTVGIDPEGRYINGHGIWIESDGSPIGDVTVGGTAPGAGNVIVDSRNAVRAIAPNVPTPTQLGALTIQGNIFGAKPDRTRGYGNNIGIVLRTAAGSAFGPVLIGGTTAAAGNLITSAAVHALGMTGLTIQGNLLSDAPFGPASSDAGGVDDESHWVVNVEGDGVFGGSAQIGGTATGAGNVIGHGYSGGVRVALTTATIEGNFIGVDRDGTTPAWNTIGILVDSADCMIGGTAAAARNVIAHNFRQGVLVDISMPEIRNSAKATILGNSIFHNDHELLGIDLGASEETPLPNDPGDGDSGPNGLQNYPILSSVSFSAGTAVINGSLDSGPNQVYRIEWFANTACDKSGNGEGQLFLGARDILTDGSGHASFDGVTLPLPPGYGFVTATATDPNGNTSEFSPCAFAIGPNASFHTLPPCRIIDTRDTDGPYGGPPLDSGSAEGRLFVIAGRCGVPVGAAAVAANIAVTRASNDGNLEVYPAGSPLPLNSAINWKKGKTRSNNAILSLGPDGDILVHVNQSGGTVDLVLDTNGYFQ